MGKRPGIREGRRGGKRYTFMNGLTRYNLDINVHMCRGVPNLGLQLQIWVLSEATLLKQLDAVLVPNSRPCAVSSYTNQCM